MISAATVSLVHRPLLGAAGTSLFPPPTSTAAAGVDSLFYFILLVSIFFFAIIVGVMMLFVVKYRERPERMVEDSPSHNNCAGGCLDSNSGSLPWRDLLLGLH